MASNQSQELTIGREVEACDPVGGEVGEGARRKAIQRLQPDITHRIFLDAVGHRFTIRSEAQVANGISSKPKRGSARTGRGGVELSSERNLMNL